MPTVDGLALLRRRQGALHAIGNTPEVLTVGGLPLILFLALHPAGKYAADRHVTPNNTAYHRQARQPVERAKPKVCPRRTS